MNKKYTHIFFDLDNTLWDFEKNSKKAMEETFGFYELKNQADFELFFKIYTKNNIELWNKYRNKELGKKELIVKRFKNTFSETSISGIDPEEMNNHYLKVMPKQKVLIDGAIDILEYLKKKNYQLSVITNGFREVQTEKIISSGLHSFFFKVFVSEDVKTPKPGREIFEYAMKSSNAKKSKCIMIGDDWEVDIIGALNVGFDAIHYRNHNNCNAINDLPRLTESVFEISKLKQLEYLF
ncbi:MAG: YjjG family noncanonical pyrimidine nucleotidase [Prolixibacteraceae bacterium]|nr:YjjG family noncanonical pyrimidine nucleotidase [Prolixibacteraceae bacterium]